MMNGHRLSSGCTCNATGSVHAASCGCHRADEFLAAPTAAYLQSRRAFLRNALVGGLTVAAMPLLEAQAAADIFKPSVSDQKRLGAQAAAQVLQKYREVRDSRARTFRNVGGRLVDALSSKERGPWDYRFRVIESKEINAFAVPGGNMFMFTGLLERIGSDDELAAVTGHEMTHVRKEHWARAVAERTKRELGIGLILGLTHANQGWRQLAGIGDTLLTLRYSRGEEDEADAGGLANMVEARYDPHGMLDLFETLQRAAGRRGEPPEFLSDHPLTSDRIRRTQERIARLDEDQLR
ncbi:MAG TPA: M48 family metalloprotease [Chthonomonadaceae bacterium]|nr:M48 family metalloprotease [Chthonomonadaceae bacterium]